MRSFPARVACAVALAVGAWAWAAIAPGRAQVDTGVVRGWLTVSGGSPQVVVWIDGARPAAPMDGSELRQADLRFAPDFLAIPVGSTVAFPNDDDVFHNVFSVSRTRRFDLGLYRSGDSREVEFERAGMVDVYCNIHPEMAAQILVLDTTLFTVSSGGAFFFTDVPAGTWELVAQPRHGDVVRTEVTVPAGGEVSADIAVTMGERPRSHRRSDGTPYGRYR